MSQVHRSHMYLLVTALLLCSLSSHVFGLYDSRSAVIELNDKNFEEKVMKSEHTFVVEFYAPWCGHCKQFAPEYAKAAKSLKNKVKVGAVDCDQDSNRPICGRFGVQGFPTVKVFYTKQKDRKRIWTDYQGAREAPALSQFALSRVPNFVKPVTASESSDSKKTLNLSRFYGIENSTIPKVLLFTDKNKITDMYKSLAIEFHYRLLFGVVVVDKKSKEKENAELMKELGVDKVPGLVVLDIENETDGKKGEAVKYDGQIKYKDLLKFLTKYAVAGKVKGSKKDSKPDTTSSVPEPTLNNITTVGELESKCFKFNLCLLSFVTPASTSPSTSPPLAELDSLLKSLSNSSINLPLNYIDLSTTKTTLPGEFGLNGGENGDPDIVVVSFKKKAYKVYRGPWVVEKLEEWVKDVVKGKGGRTALWSGKVEGSAELMQRNEKDGEGKKAAKKKGKEGDKVREEL
ncbi:hypothetical protein BKA69DRAFT_1092424 [Paraphysoderma sedebokerense]|nr:hypothetical protein BKA69DRAFT_1092424 [Paraphysoderma sedebokerense]